MRSYGQYCGLAKALDHVGDRWTLLVVRELLIGPRRYSEIREALPGIATNLLADRLRDLVADGVIRRIDKSGAYELTDFGRELEPAIHSLVRWGGKWMTQRERNDDFRPEWLAVALKALLPRRRSGTVEIRTGGAVFKIDRGRVSMGGVEDPDVVIEGEPEAILGVAAGELALSAIHLKGNRDVAKAYFA